MPYCDCYYSVGKTAKHIHREKTHLQKHIILQSCHLLLHCHVVIAQLLWWWLPGPREGWGDRRHFTQQGACDEIQTINARTKIQKSRDDCPYIYISTCVCVFVHVYVS